MAAGPGLAAAAAADPQSDDRFLPFEEAQAVAQSLNLANVFEWKAWCKEGTRPANVPTHPERTYKDGVWQGWVHWLGSGNMNIKKPSKFAPFGQALAFARSLGLANQLAWQQWCREGRDAATQRALHPEQVLQGRRVAGVGALAGQQQHQEGKQVCAVR